MAKPDNRADNVEHLQQSIQNTQKNLHEAEEYLNEFSSEISDEERSSIQEKNQRRKKKHRRLPQRGQGRSQQFAGVTEDRIYRRSPTRGRASSLCIFS